VASEAQQSIDFTDVMLERRYSGARAYGQSKFAMVTAGFALARRLDAATVTVNSLHPGTMMPTKPVLAALGHSVDSLQTGVAAVGQMALDPAVAGRTGLYFNRRRIGRPHPESLRPEVQEQVWALGAEITRVTR